MDWLNIHTSTLDSPAFVGSGPVERSSWLCLLRFCIGQENGGRITGARAWKDRQWQQLARVTLREVMAKSQLWTWEDNDLVVSFYPTSKESEVKARREVARRNGMLGGRPERTKAVTHEEPTSVNFEKAEGERKEKGKEGEGELKLGEAALPSAKRFTPPTPAEVAEYSRSIGYPLNGEAWCDSYAQKGWKVGKNTMKDWRAAVRTWKANGYTLGNGQASAGTPVPKLQYV